MTGTLSVRPRQLAVTETTVVAGTSAVVSGKPAGAPSSATVALAGTCTTCGLLLDSSTTEPAGVRPENTVPEPMVTPPGSSTGPTPLPMPSRRSAAGCTVSGALALPSARRAVSVTVVSASTCCGSMAKLAVALPAGTSTVAGSDATAGLLLASPTVAPPAGAGPSSSRCRPRD